MSFFPPNLSPSDLVNRTWQDAETFCQFNGVTRMPVTASLDEQSSDESGIFKRHFGAAPIPRLNVGRCPPHIVRFVVPVVIDSIKSMVWRWRRTYSGDNICGKSSEGSTPLLAYGDASTTVTLKSLVLRVIAALFHEVPAKIKRMLKEPFAVVNPATFHAVVVARKPQTTVSTFARTALIGDSGIDHWRGSLALMVLKAGGVSALSA